MKFINLVADKIYENPAYLLVAALGLLFLAEIAWLFLDRKR